MFGLAFSNRATSATHSLCCTGCCAAGGAQLMEIVTGPLVPLPAAVPLGDGLLEQAAAVRTRPAAAAAAATTRWRSALLDQSLLGFLFFVALGVCRRRLPLRCFPR